MQVRRSCSTGRGVTTTGDGAVPLFLVHPQGGAPPTWDATACPMTTRRDQTGGSSPPRRRRTVAIATMLVLAVAADTAVAAHGGLLSSSKSCEGSVVRLSMMTSPDIAPRRACSRRQGAQGPGQVRRALPPRPGRRPRFVQGRRCALRRHPHHGLPDLAARLRSLPGPCQGHGRGHPDHSRRLLSDGDTQVLETPAQDDSGAEGGNPQRNQAVLLSEQGAFAHNAGSTGGGSLDLFYPKDGTPLLNYPYTLVNETKLSTDESLAAPRFMTPLSEDDRAAHPGEARLQGDRRDDRAGAGHIGRRQGTPAVHHFIRHSPGHRGRPGDARHVDDHGAERTADRGRRPSAGSPRTTRSICGSSPPRSKAPRTTASWCRPPGSATP